jgi:hypothetical protein
VKNNYKAKLQLIFLVILFAGPFLLSWYLVFYSDFKQNEKGIEHGKLVIPVIELGKIKGVSINTKQETTLEGKWILTGFVDNACDKHCEDLLYKIRQLRLAVGKDINRVDRLIVTDNVNFEKYTKDFAGQNITASPEESSRLIELFNQNDAFNKEDIFLIDQYGFLMMQYTFNTEPKLIIKDLERLLRNSK